MYNSVKDQNGNSKKKKIILYLLEKNIQHK